MQPNLKKEAWDEGREQGLHLGASRGPLKRRGQACSSPPIPRHLSWTPAGSASLATAPRHRTPTKASNLKLTSLPLTEETCGSLEIGRDRNGASSGGRARGFAGPEPGGSCPSPRRPGAGPVGRPWLSPVAIACPLEGSFLSAEDQTSPQHCPGLEQAFYRALLSNVSQKHFGQPRSPKRRWASGQGRRQAPASRGPPRPTQVSEPPQPCSRAGGVGGGPTVPDFDG